MTTTISTDLDRLLERAAAAPANERMHYRNDVATHGENALAHLEPWLVDGRLATFAVRTIGRIGDDPAVRMRASSILKSASSTMTEHARKDAAFILAGWRTRPSRPRVDSKAPIPMDRDLREELIEGARGQRLMTYSEVGEPIGLTMRNPGQRTYLGKLLDVVSRYESLGGRPLLSSIVVHKGDQWPGDGFVVLGEELGLVLLGEDAKAFAQRQVIATFEYWRTHADPDVTTA